MLSWNYGKYDYSNGVDKCIREETGTAGCVVYGMERRLCRDRRCEWLREIDASLNSGGDAEAEVGAGVLLWQGGMEGGGRMHGNREVIRRMTGYVPQENPLIPELSVYDNLRLWYPDKKTLQNELEQGFLNLLGLDEFSAKRVSKLSGGMKKRVSIGIAMAGMPPVLLMDEPGAALDLICKEDIRRYLQVYLERRGTVVIATHEESELDLCSALYIMKDGRLHQADRCLRGEALTGRM